MAKSGSCACSTAAVDEEKRLGRSLIAFLLAAGSLPDGLTLENVKQGMMAKRNPIIVNALDKADYIENYATGIRRIFSEYQGFEKQPDFYISDNEVIVTLFNRNYKYESDVQNGGKKLRPKERQEKIMQLIIGNKNITIEEMSMRFGVSKPTVERDIAKLRRENKIRFIGGAKDGYWTVL